jgi:hypothetical protein
MHIGLNTIRIDCNTQSRESISPDVVDQYAEDMQGGNIFPSVIVYYDGTFYYLVDGHHRYHAAMKIGAPSLECTVVDGTLREAVLFSMTVNSKHGLPRSRADKRYCILRMLDDIEYGEYSDNHIAKLCHVGNMLVAAIRAELGRAGPAVRKYVRDGKEVLQKVREKKVVAPVEDKETEMELLRASVVDLMDDNALLKDKISIGLSGSSDEEKVAVTETIKSLRDEIVLLNVTIKAITKSRDAYQTENAELMKQIARMKKANP